LSLIPDLIRRGRAGLTTKTVRRIVPAGEPVAARDPGDQFDLSRGECAVRKRPILIAAAVAVTGLAALGTVMAQQPRGTPPATTAVRPYAEWTPTTPPAGSTTQPGAVRPAGGYLPPPAGYTPHTGAPGTKPRLSAPGVAGADQPIRPAGGIDIPPPSMELPGVSTPPGRPLPPPNVNVDSGDSKFPPSPPVSAGTPGLAPPPAGPGGLPPVPVLPPPPGGPLPPSTAPPPIAPPAGSGVAPKPLPLPLPAAPPGPDALTTPTPTPAPTSGAPTGPAGLPPRVSQSVTVEAVCPDSVVFGQEFRYDLLVRNSGNVAVQNVRVEDEIPTGVRYVGSDPPGELSGDKLVWSIGTLDAAGEKRIAVRVRPTAEGDIRSRATVSFATSVEAKTKVTRPRVAVSVTGPETSRAGEDAVFQIKVSNSGTGPAQQMVLQAVLSDGLFHQQGAKLETRLANLPAGETKTLSLPLGAVKAGTQVCQVTVTAEGSSDATAKASVNVVEPLLRVAQSGPAKCLVRAEPTYEITLSNPGTCATDAITVHAVLPDGFEYVQSSDAGAYSAANRAISWKLSALPAGGTKAVALKLRAASAGDVVLRTVAYAGQEPAAVPAGGAPAKPGRVLEAKAETAVKAEGVPAVRFEVVDLDDPVEVGKEAVYEVRVTNQGTGACTNVQLMAALADGTTFTGSNGPTQIKAQGQTLVFDPIPNLPVKGEMVYRVRVRGNAPGDLRLRVQLTCDQVRTPVVKEESTRFYKE
jgi:uncharacterized repeat protein (TIGR01451 family)